MGVTGSGWPRSETRQLICELTLHPASHLIKDEGAIPSRSTTYSLWAAAWEYTGWCQPSLSSGEANGSFGSSAPGRVE